jgi:ketosteroid isomerase-like protein
MTTTTTTNSLDTRALVAAIEQRDAEALTALYAADAVVTITDRDHPPAAPSVLSGQAEIAAYYRDLCGRNIDHAVSMLVADASGLGFEQHCRYPEGNAVICVTVASVEGGLIRRQTIAQAWD